MFSFEKFKSPHGINLENRITLPHIHIFISMADAAAAAAALCVSE